MSRKHGREKYVKSFDRFMYLLTILFAVIMRDSLREIEVRLWQSEKWQRKLDKVP